MSMHSSRKHQADSSSQKVSDTHQADEPDRLSSYMSDMQHMSVREEVPGTVCLSRIACSASMSRDHHLFYCICSHVGYTSAYSRLATCPGQSARNCNSRFETCPGQRARKLHSRQVACSEQSACTAQRNCSSWSCPGQTAHQHTMAQSRERSASLESDLAEIKFWTFWIGCKNLKQCVRDAPSSTRSFDVPQSDWWKELRGGKLSESSPPARLHMSSTPGVSETQRGLHHASAATLARMW